MTFLKFRGEQLFTGRQMLDGSHVLVTDEAGIIEDIVHISEAGEDVQKFDGIICPGFVNCHCHLELSHMKGLIPELTGLIDFVFAVVTHRHFPEEEILDAIKKAEQEMLESGIVAVGDICNNLLTLPQKQRGNLHYYNFIEASGWLPAVAEARIERALGLYKAFAAIKAPSILNNFPRAGNSIVPHAPYSVSADLWRHLTPYFSGKVATIHNQETSFEDELFLSGTGDFIRMYEMMKMDSSFHAPTGKTSLQSYFKNLQQAKVVLLVHNSYTSLEDIVYAQNESAKEKQELYWCICINANVYIESAIPPVNRLLQSGSNIVLGTDSLASNHGLNLLEEIKTIHLHFPGIPLSEMLQWATLNGAKALQIEHILGSFDKGKQPGIVLIEDVTNGELNKNTGAKRVL